METVTLNRWCTSTMGVFGTLTIGDFECITVERPWVGNLPTVSCIPAGVYTLRRDYYNTGCYEAFEICDVPGRSRILIHIGNTIRDVKGCVAVGKDLGWVNNLWAVTDSRYTFNRFMDAMHGIDETTISIRFTIPT